MEELFKLSQEQRKGMLELKHAQSEAQLDTMKADEVPPTAPLNTRTSMPCAFRSVSSWRGQAISG